MKKLIFFHEPSTLWNSHLQHCYENHKMVGYEHKRVFEEYGYPTVVCDVGKWQDIAKVLQLLKNDSVFFTMGTNAAGLDLYTVDGEGLLEKYPVPHIAFFADHPYLNRELFMDRLKNARIHKLFFGLVNGMADEKCIELEGFNKIEGCIYAAPYFDFENDRSNEERDIDVLFTGRLYSNKAPDRSWNHTCLSSEIKNQLNEVADYLECYAVSVYDGFCNVLREYGKKEGLPKLYPYFSLMLSYIMQWRRLRLVETLVRNQVPLVMCDASWHEHKYSNKMRILATKYQETLQLYKRAKIVVADLAGFNNYTHDRVLHAVKYGAAVICEQSTWMEKYFYSSGAMKGFDWKLVGDVPNMVNDLLDNEAERADMTERAYDILKNNFSGKQYVEKIISVISDAGATSNGREI